MANKVTHTKILADAYKSALEISADNETEEFFGSLTLDEKNLISYLFSVF